jgi:nucleotide-binding universal stress UspA family protein
MGGEQVFAAVAAVPTEITFGEGDKATKKSALDALTEFVDGLGEIVPEGKVTDTSRTAAPAGKLVRFNAPASEHTVVDQESVEMAEAAAALAQEKNIPFGEALTQVRHARTAAGAASSAAV